MSFTKLHINAFGLFVIGTGFATLMALSGHECFAGQIFAGSLGLSINFAEKKDNGTKS